MTTGKILKIKYGYNPNSSDIGSQTSGIMSEILKNATAKITTTSTLGKATTLAESTVTTSTTQITTASSTTLQQAISNTSPPTWLIQNGTLDFETTQKIHLSSQPLTWLIQNGVLDIVKYLLSAVITSLIIYFTAKKLARMIRKNFKKGK